MKKNYSDWHELKKGLNEKSHPDRFFYEREIWYCSIGVNIRHEQDGKHSLFERPVIILKKFNEHTFWGIPLSKSKKRGKCFFSFTHYKTTSCALLSQLRLWDSNRLDRKIGILPERKFIILTKRIKSLLPKYGKFSADQAPRFSQTSESSDNQGIYPTSPKTIVETD